MYLPVVCGFIYSYIKYFMGIHLLKIDKSNLPCSPIDKCWLIKRTSDDQLCIVLIVKHTSLLTIKLLHVICTYL